MRGRVWGEWVDDSTSILFLVEIPETRGQVAVPRVAVEEDANH